MVRAPPGEWLVVDGCSGNAKAYAPQVLRHYGGRCRLVVFTHPHSDHARGVAEVIDEATAGPFLSWPRVGMLPLFASALPPPTPGTDPAAEYEGGVAEQACATVVDRWDRHPPCRWDLTVGADEPLGSASVRALSPSAVAVGRNGRDVNTLATALTVEWEGRRILLGSDLVESPGSGWSAALSAYGGLATHDLAKIPHHGSVKAIHAPVFPSPVTGIITPFSTKHLPRFDAAGGVALLHSFGVDVVLTSLPRAHASQAGTPRTIMRSDLASDPTVRLDPQTTGFPDCFVCASFDRTVAPPRLHYGPGSVRVNQ